MDKNELTLGCPVTQPDLDAYSEIACSLSVEQISVETHFAFDSLQKCKIGEIKITTEEFCSINFDSNLKVFAVGNS